MSEDTVDLGSNLDTPAPVAKTRKPKDAKGDTHTWIVLEENDDIPPTGQFVGLNGKGYLIVPGQPVHVPNGICEILDNAVVSMPHLEAGTGRVIGSRERMRFPYRRLSESQIAQHLAIS